MLLSLHIAKMSFRPYLAIWSACAAFSLKKTKVMHQGSDVITTLIINEYTLEVVPQFPYLGSTTSANGSLDAELGKKIGKAATIMTKPSFRVCESRKLTIQTKITVFRIMDNLCRVGKALTHLPYEIPSMSKNGFPLINLI